MGTFRTRGLRGSAFEDMINSTNEYYLKNNLALIQKIPTPITPVELDSNHNRITLAYFDKRSTVDYIGVVQGVPVCFDAKESHEDLYPLKNIHEHQVQFMTDFEAQGGVAFILMNFTKRNKLYYLRFEELKKFWDRQRDGGRKSFKFDELDQEFFFEATPGVVVPYLIPLKKDLNSRD